MVNARVAWPTRGSPTRGQMQWIAQAALFLARNSDVGGALRVTGHEWCPEHFSKAGQLLIVCGQPGRRGLSRRCWTPEHSNPPLAARRAGSRRAHSYQKYVLVYILFHISRSSVTAKLTRVPEVAGRELARELARDARFSAAASSSASSFLVLRQQLGHSAGVPCRPFDK